MSSDPTGTSAPSIRRISPASLRARSSPRAAIPTRTSPAAPLFRSRISSAMRVIAALTSLASRGATRRLAGRQNPRRHDHDLVVADIAERMGLGQVLFSEPEHASRRELEVVKHLPVGAERVALRTLDHDGEVWPPM